MAGSFSKPSFDYHQYTAFRPKDPPQLFRYLLDYHSPAPTSVHLDLGSGAGIVLPCFSPPFTTRHAVDPSEPMLTLAKSLLPPQLLSTTHFHLSRAESLPFIADNSIALTTAAEAAHWFSQPEIWNELARVARRPGGTIAFWGFNHFIFPEYPRASKVLLKYYQNPQEGWGPYWYWPGRAVLDGFFRALQPPNDGRWERVERWEYEPAFSPESTARTEIVWQNTLQPEPDAEAVAQSSGVFGKLVKQGEGLWHENMKLWEFGCYLRTLSAVHSWIEAHPEHKSLRDGGQGDVVDWCLEEMREVEGWNQHDWREMLIDVEWDHAVLCIKRTDKE